LSFKKASRGPLDTRTDLLPSVFIRTETSHDRSLAACDQRALVGFALPLQYCCVAYLKPVIACLKSSVVRTDAPLNTHVWITIHLEISHLALSNSCS
jgi:hypothetical protein